MTNIHLWGVLGSVPGASHELLDYGTNTSCISIKTDNALIILDAGSGIVHTKEITEGMKEIHLFISHYHMDHLVGFPMWAPLFNPDVTIHIYGPTLNGIDVESAIKGFIRMPYFPITMESMSATIHFHEVKESTDIWVDECRVESLLVSHPGGNYVYKIHNSEFSFLYLTDIDLKKTNHKDLLSLAKDAKLAYLDTHFTQDEYVMKQYQGWGHSSLESGIDFKNEAKIGTILFGHHAPHRTCATLMKFIERNQDKEVIIAKEGMRFEFE
jgi:ribonuclease BN (tRNA processing enzyme)